MQYGAAPSGAPYAAGKATAVMMPHSAAASPSAATLRGPQHYNGSAFPAAATPQYNGPASPAAAAGWAAGLTQYNDFWGQR